MFRPDPPRRLVLNLSALGAGLVVGAVAWLALGGLAGASMLDVSPAEPVGAFQVSADAVQWLIRLGAFCLGIVCGR